MLDSILRLWWGRLPAVVYRLSPQAGLGLADGVHLVEWPALGALAAPAALVLGLVVGWQHPGFHFVWAESIALIALIVAVGTMSASLGGLLVLGYAIGDFLLGDQHWPVSVPPAAPGVFGALLPETLRLRLPLLIGYLLLLLVGARIPLLAKTLMADALRGLAGRLPRSTIGAIALAGHAIVSGALVWAWVHALPVLIRPRFTWIGALAPPDTVFTPLQTQGDIVIAAAVVASLVRMMHQLALASRKDVQARFDVLQAPVISVARLATPPSRARLWVRSASAAVMTALLACGILANVAEVLIILGGTFALYAARAGLVTVPLGRWPELVTRVPMVLRLLAAWIAIQWLASQLLVNSLVTAGQEDLFRPFVVTTVLGLSIAYLVAPHAAQRTEPAGERDASRETTGVTP
jgi:hypothetical protein